jgi:hypothetical protein
MLFREIVAVYCENQSESESELLYDWRFTANQFVLATGPLRPITSNFIIQLNTCSYSPYVTSSLTRGWVCRLQLLLSSPAQSYSDPSPAGLMTIFYCLRFEIPPAWRIRSLYLYPPGTGWSGYTPRHWVPFSSPRGWVSYITTDAQIYENSVRTSQETHYVSAAKSSRLMLFTETVAVYCKTRTEHTNTVTCHGDP